MSNIRFQFIILILGICIGAIKFWVYFASKSNAVFSDALESLVNISANMITLYSLYYAAKPKDSTHPYGHGKVEYIASAIEGSLLFSAGIFTIYKSVHDYLSSTVIDISNTILFSILILGVFNYVLGYFSEKRGLQVNSSALIASGKHLKSDGYTTFGILVSMILLYWTQENWIDTLVAILVGLYIIYNGFCIVIQSLKDIVDTADISILEKLIPFLQKNRKQSWIDIHNFRILKFGSEYHIDAHMTLPFYFTNKKVHDELKELDNIINQYFDSKVELFIHSDPCENTCCHYCGIQSCNERKEVYSGQIEWTLKNVLIDEKHSFKQAIS